MRSYSSVERMVSDLEREARELRGEKDRLREELVWARTRRIELTKSDSSTWHGVRFAVQVGVALLLIAALAIAFAVGVP